MPRRDISVNEELSMAIVVLSNDENTVAPDVGPSLCTQSSHVTRARKRQPTCSNHESKVQRKEFHGSKDVVLLLAELLGLLLHIFFYIYSMDNQTPCWQEETSIYEGSHREQERIIVGTSEKSTIEAALIMIF